MENMCATVFCIKSHFCIFQFLSFVGFISWPLAWVHLIIDMASEESLGTNVLFSWLKREKIRSDFLLNFSSAWKAQMYKTCLRMYHSSALNTIFIAFSALCLSVPADHCANGPLLRAYTVRCCKHTLSAAASMQCTSSVLGLDSEYVVQNRNHFFLSRVSVVRRISFRVAQDFFVMVCTYCCYPLWIFYELLLLQGNGESLHRISQVKFIL